MVRIYNRVIKRLYLNKKGVYLYHFMAVPIPRMLQEKLQPYIGRDLNIDITIDAPAQKITISLKAKPAQWQESFSTKKTPTQKHEESTPEPPLDDGQ